MIVILGLVILVAALIVGVAGVAGVRSRNPQLEASHGCA
jgi:hypothetical protein